MVSNEFGHLLEYHGVTGTPRGLNGPIWALVEERGGNQEVGVPPKPNPNWEGGGLSFFTSSPSFPLLLGLGKGGTYS